PPPPPRPRPRPKARVIHSEDSTPASAPAPLPPQNPPANSHRSGSISRHSPIPPEQPESSNAAQKRGQKRKAQESGPSVKDRQRQEAAPAVNERPTKRSRVQALEPSSENAWFRSALKMLTEGSTGLGDDGQSSLGKDWVALLGSWSQFQRKAGFEKASYGRLSTQHRPVVMKEWINRARVAIFRPDIPSLPDYEKDFMAWWTVLQPLWRVVDGKIDVRKIRGNWTALKQSGPNGWLNIIAALFFWGISAHGTKHMKGWKSAVADVKVALTQIAS
ncbi:hypothetical protein CVT24_004717, partial [Panaeolus cyanescens]